MGNRVKPDDRQTVRGPNGRFTKISPDTEKTLDIPYTLDRAVEVKRVSPGERVLNEALTATQEYLHIGTSEAVALVLFAAASHVIDVFPAFPRMLFVGNGPSCGKTAAMLVTAYLSSNPQNAKGSSYAVTSSMAEATNQPEKDVPTYYRDEISQVFGLSGLNNSKDPIADILRDGYKRNAMTSWSVNRVKTDIRLYYAAIMAGLATAVPLDIRTRSIVITMERGRPLLDLDSDGAEDRLRLTAKAMGAAVKAQSSLMRGYTCDNVVKGLNGRVHQVWRPLLAIARFVGGERWYDMAKKACDEMINGAAPEEILSADQQIAKDLVAVLAKADTPRTSHVGGRWLSEELSCLPRFEGRNDTSIAKEIARVMRAYGFGAPVQRRIPNHENAVSGYAAGQIYDVWEMIRPVSASEIAPMEDTEINPFD